MARWVGSSSSNEPSDQTASQNGAEEASALIKRYILQLRYGCTSAECTTPHCFSSKTRFATAPVRRPNPYTARMQAMVLATRPDAHKALCRHPPRHMLDDFGSVEGIGSNSVADASGVQKLERTKDDKSLVQALFSTSPWRRFEGALENGDFSGVQLASDVHDIHIGPSDNVHPVRFGDLSDADFWLLSFEDDKWQILYEGKTFTLQTTTDHWDLQETFLRTETHRDWIFWNLARSVKAIFPRPIQKSNRPQEFQDADDFLDHFLELSDDEAVHILGVCCDALVSNMIRNNAAYDTQGQRIYGLPKSVKLHFSDLTFMIQEGDFMHPPVQHLLARMIRGIAARRAYWELSKHITGSDEHTDISNQRVNFPLMRKLLDHLLNMRVVQRHKILTPVMLTAITDYLKSIVSREWDGSHVVSRWGTAGGALEMLKDIYAEIPLWASRDRAFQHAADRITSFRLQSEIPIDLDHFDSKLSLSYIEQVPNPNVRHILEFPFLFPTTLVHNFRAINYSKMFAAYRTSGFIDHMSNHLSQIMSQDLLDYVHRTMPAATTRHLLLDLRRENMLEDAFNQLRGREKRELQKPLKIRLGLAEGMEIGVDQGGVAQEFFRLVFQKAFDDDYGMFVTDEASKRSWFRAASPVELYKFELVGLLFSLAVYNGAIVTANLPLALYRRLILGVTSTSIMALERDWPTHYKSLNTLATWNEEDGKVGDIFGLEYKFSNDDAQLLQSVQQPTDENAPMVTAKNRYKYIDDYVYWLTYKSVQPQLEAFSRGFHALLDEKALSILPPQVLQQVVEGFHDLNIDTLQLHAKAKNWENDEKHPLVVAFWDIVKQWSPERQKLLLKFVTASDRVPAMGYKSVNFVLERNGGDSDLLPSSSTCFGLLMMPEYSSKEKMESKLAMALENCEGFGVP